MAFNIMDAIKNREQIAPPEPKQNGRMKIQYISVKNIVPALDKRNYYSTEKIESLKASIAVHGVKQNLLVKAIEGGKYELIAGECRWRCSSALFEEGKPEFEFVPCSVERPADDLDQRILLTTLNSTAREISDYEKGLQVQEMNEILDEYERRGATIEAPRRELLMKHLNLTSGQVGRYTAIHNHLSEIFMREYVKKEISVSVAYELSRLSEEKQAEALALYKEQGGLSIKDVKALQKMKEPEQKEQLEFVDMETGGADEYRQAEFEEAEPEKEEKSWEDMTPCEICRSANPSCAEDHCCKTCEEHCNGRQICRIDEPPEECQREIDEWNQFRQEQLRKAEASRAESEKPEEPEAEPALLVIEGPAKPKGRMQEEEPADPGVLKIEAAKYTMGVLEREIEKCGIEIRYAEEQGKTAKGALAAAKLEYLGWLLSKVQGDLFDMTGDDMFREEWG